jgi:hypothetical protein
VPPQVLAIAITSATEKPGVVTGNGEKVIKPVTLCLYASLSITARAILTRWYLLLKSWTRFLPILK